MAFNQKKYSYLKDDDKEEKKTKGTKICNIKHRLKFGDYKNCLRALQRELLINYLKNKTLMLMSQKRIYGNFLKENRFIMRSQQRF